MSGSSGTSGLYRPSLASRVTLLTTMAVGLAVTVVALAAYLTVRHQTLTTLDDSLHDRATRAAHSDTLDALSSSAVPVWLKIDGPQA